MIDKAEAETMLKNWGAYFSCVREPGPGRHPQALSQGSSGGGTYPTANTDGEPPDVAFVESFLCGMMTQNNKLVATAIVHYQYGQGATHGVKTMLHEFKIKVAERT
ncbi:MAG: hypothetical protein AAF387_18640, partial [Pseudomonadota bacterium]